MPVDSIYLAEAALRAFQRRQKFDEFDVEGANERMDLGEQIRRLGEQRTTNLQKTRVGAAREGLFYSTQLGKRFGEVETQHARQQGDMQRDFDRRQAAREAARRAIEAGAPLEEAAAQAAAADRQIDLDTAAADDNSLVANPAPAARARPARPAKPVKPRPAPKPAPRPNTAQGRGVARPPKRPRR